jgi:hypothetical protein
MENTKANTKSLSDSILEFTNSATPAVTDAAEKSVEAAETSAGGFFGWIQSISLLTWIIIILVLAFFGFNIFLYLAKGTEEVNSVLAPLLKSVFGTTFGLVGETIDTAAEGGKAVVTTTATGVNAGLSAVQGVTPNKASSSVHSTSVEENKKEIEEAENSLNKALNKSSQKNKKSSDNDDYEPHEASSSVHTGKAGWCFIGEDRGHRSCSKVGLNDKCMSGDIFPSQELCINPNLRA